MPPKKKKKKTEPVEEVTVAQPKGGIVGQEPEFRTTVQGDRFDINRAISRKDFKSHEAFVQAGKIQKSRGFGGFEDERQMGRPRGLKEQQIAEQEQAARAVEAAAVPLAQPELDVGAAVGKFQDVEVFPERSLFGKLSDTPLGQAMIGDVALEKIKEEDFQKAYLDKATEMIDSGLSPQQITNDPAMQMLLSLELNERDLEVLNSGRADVDTFTQLVEGLPVVGTLARQFGGGAIVPTVPAARLDALAQKIEKMGNKMRDYRMASARNPGRRNEYLNLVDDAELAIRDAESRIKLLIIQSPTLQNSPEEVEKIQETIARALARTTDVRGAIIQGETIEQALMLSQLKGGEI